MKTTFPKQIAANLAKVWFVATLYSNVLLAWSLIKAINSLPDFIINADRKREISATVCCFVIKTLFYLNPQIKIKSLNDWNLINPNQPFVMLINHTSPVDSLIFFSSLPLKYAAKTKTLFKGDLLQMPFLGSILQQCGHFPVHFKHTEDGKFSVDPVKQGQVTEDIKAHLKNGGSLAFFPEGQLNKTNTFQLQPFRRGLLSLLAELNSTATATENTATKAATVTTNMYAFLHRGVEKTWPPKATVGGNPSQVSYKIFPLLFSKGAQTDQIQATVQQSMNSMSSHFSHKFVTPKL